MRPASATGAEERVAGTVGIALAGFALMAALGPVLGWSAGDLMWGLLLTSLATCVIAALFGVFSLWYAGWRHMPAGDAAGKARLLATTPFAAGFCAVLVTVCYGFHALYALIIYFLFPLWPEIPGSFDLDGRLQGLLLAEAAERYWPFVAASLAADWRELVRPLTEPGAHHIGRPWKLLFRMHLFIFVAITVVVLGGTGYPFYLLILLFFFFPWRLVIRRPFRRPAASD